MFWLWLFAVIVIVIPVALVPVGDEPRNDLGADLQDGKPDNDMPEAA